ncbi:MAG: winged helix DNA-binding protein [Candidatus Aenigmarchaeota archaeon]|nr:winged helix DNA-binding protein [Candidatus Aenigmarchaeota archaeon]
MKEKQNKNMFESLFLHTKPVRMLTVLNKESIKYATQVSKAVDCTYSHTVKVLEQFKNMGLVQFDKKGRIKLIKLTEIGEEVAHDFEGIRRKFLRMASQIKEPISKKKQKKKEVKK